jgi:hypothetical protein
MERMMTLRPLSVLLLAAALGVFGCGTGPTEQATEAPASETPAGTQPESVAAVFNHYEEARALLAADKTEGLAAAAEAIGQSANAAKADVSEGAAAHLGMTADEAAKLAAASGDIAKARLAFGEVSRHLIQTVMADPSLATGRLAIHCPMAEGYQHWIQTTAAVSNPHMGTAMPDCGAAVKFEEAAAAVTN